MKKPISVILALLMVLSILPTYAAMSFAEEPSFAGPNDSDHSYLDIHSNGEKYSLYFMGNTGDAKIEGVSYDLATNTLTLNNYNEPSTIIEAGEMGADFKIAVIGENYIKAVSIFADRYMGSLIIVGDGSLSVNAKKELDGIPVYIDANYTGSVLEVEDSVKFAVYVNDDETAIKVRNSLNENPIICAETETRICDFDSSYTNKKWIYAKDTQMNTFFKVKDSDSYVTYCYDEYSGSDALCEFVLVNRNIDGEEVIFADQTMDEMGNPIIIPDDNVNFSENVRVHQIMNSFERAAVEKAGDETEYTLSEYTNNGMGPFFDVHKVIHDEELGTFFYPVVLELTEKPTEYSYIYEEVRESFKYIEYDFANFENEEPVESEMTFTAKVKDCDITYHNGDNIYIEAGKTELICFDIFDEDVPYVPAWYSFDMAASGFEIAPEPVVIGDTYYASITNNAVIGNTGTLVVNAFSAEKFADPSFDFITTQPDATFDLNIVSAEKYSGVIMVEDKEYPENSTITMKPGETIEMHYLVPGYPGFCLHTINPDLLTEAGFTFEQKFDEEDMPYAFISSNGVKPGTKATVPLAIKRFEDCVINDFNFAITPSIYEYAVTIEVAGNNSEPCEHNYSSGTVLKQPTCSAFGEKEVACTLCGEKVIINKDNFTQFDQNLWNGVFPLGHTPYNDFSEGTILVKPTCSSLGEFTWKCKRCGEAQYDLIVKDLDNHTFKTVTTKATATANGSVVTKCAGCGKIKSTKAINKIGTVSLGTTKYVYNGKVQKPALTVKDSKGNVIAASNYTASWSDASSKAVGTYTVKVTFKGNYSGNKTLTYTILPQQVTGLKASAVNTTSIKLTWTKVTGAKYYKVEQSTDGKTWKVAATVSTNAATIKSLKAGTKYQFRVTALDGAKKIAGKASAVLKTGTLTSAPTVTLKSSKSKTAVASWKKVAGATSYIVYKSTDGKKWTKVTATTALTCSITKLTGGKKIYVKVTAVNAYSKESAASKVQNVTVKK